MPNPPVFLTPNLLNSLALTLEAAKTGHEKQKTLGKPRVLIIEDEDEIRRVMGLLLAFEGFEVREASNGAEAIDALLDDRAPQPDVILLDLLMPIMKGEEFLDWKKQSARAEISRIPVVVTTGAAELRPYLNGQVTSVLKKPITADLLLNEIRKALTQPQANSTPT
jgi:CheY-like chemotaxis protein